MARSSPCACTGGGLTFSGGLPHGLPRGAPAPRRVPVSVRPQEPRQLWCRRRVVGGRSCVHRVSEAAACGASGTGARGRPRSPRPRRGSWQARRPRRSRTSARRGFLGIGSRRDLELEAFLHAPPHGHRGTAVYAPKHAGGTSDDPPNARRRPRPDAPIRLRAKSAARRATPASAFPRVSPRPCRARLAQMPCFWPPRSRRGRSSRPPRTGRTAGHRLGRSALRP